MQVAFCCLSTCWSLVMLLFVVVVAVVAVVVDSNYDFANEGAVSLSSLSIKFLVKEEDQKIDIDFGLLEHLHDSNTVVL